MSLIESIHQGAAWLEATPLGEAFANSEYLFPGFESVHVIGLTLMLGTIAFVDLRLLGLASTKRAVRDISQQMLPIAWTGFAIALISGALMFAANASRYLDNPAFQVKMLILLLAGVNMALFHFLTWKSIDEWDHVEHPPTAVKAAGGVSLSCWVVIVFLGRWIGFL